MHTAQSRIFPFRVSSFEFRFSIRQINYNKSKRPAYRICVMYGLNFAFFGWLVLIKCLLYLNDSHKVYKTLIVKSLRQHIDRLRKHYFVNPINISIHYALLKGLISPIKYQITNWIKYYPITQSRMEGQKPTRKYLMEYIHFSTLCIHILLSYNSLKITTQVSNNVRDYLLLNI